MRLIRQRQIGPLAAFAAFALLPCGRAAEPPWLLLESPRFAIVSQLGEKETTSWAAEFDEFVHAVSLQFTVDPRMLRPLTVVLLKSDRDFHSYKPKRPDGGRADVSGFFASRETWSVIGLSGGFGHRETRRVIFHEGVHWVTDATPQVMPLWWQEGLAELFSTFQMHRGRATWGHAIPSHLELLRSERLVKPSRLVLLTRDDPLFNVDHRTGIFYAHSWAFVQSLMRGKNHDFRAAIAAYTQALQEKVEPRDAFRNAFDTSYEEVEAEIKLWTQRGFGPVAAMEVSDHDTNDHKLATARPATVEAALARLALGGGSLGLATRHAQRAVQLEPEYAPGHEVLAWIAFQNALNDISDGSNIPFVATKEEWPRVDRILAHAKRAAELGSHDPWMYYLLGYHCSYPGFFSGATSDELSRYAADQYRHAIKLWPNIRVAYQNLAIAAGADGVFNEGDRTALLQGRQLFPQDGLIVLGLATIAWGSGDGDAALDLLKQAKEPEMILIPAARFVARELEAQLSENSLTARVDQLMSENKISEALDLYDLEIAVAGNTRLKRSLEQKRTQLMFETKSQQAFEAMAAEDFHTAIRHLEEILRWPDLSRGQRAAAMKNLGTVNRKRLESL